MSLLGQELINRGVLTQDQLDIVLAEQKHSKERLGELVVKLGFTTTSVIREVLSESLDQDSIDLSHTIPESDALALVPIDVAKQFKVVPVTFNPDTNELTLAVRDVLDFPLLDRVGARLERVVHIKPLLSTEVDIEAAIDQFYGYELSVDGILEEIETGNTDYEQIEQDSGEYSQPLVRLVDALLADAVKRRTSDIHFEPELGFLRIRYRIDGVLRQIRVLHNQFWAPIAVRLKVMSGMNIAESRATQDGRISLKIMGRTIDFRVAVQPTIYGENIVLRILDRARGIMDLEKLDLSDYNFSQLQLMMARPEGVIFLTGPTGSGKTTTLYSMLSKLNSEKVNIMTLEDPVEYPMPMIRQSNVNEAVKLDFSSGVRSMLRQDPDIILVGEVRDEDTAKMSLRAAMTGHQVYTTLHTNSALGAVPRLKDMGVSEDLLSGNIIGIVAQRLVRKLCTHCKTAYQPEAIEYQLMGRSMDETVTLYKPSACEQCDNTGYYGRMSLMEILRMTPELDDLIAKKATAKALLESAHASGFVPIIEDGIRAVLKGDTSLEEVSRVIDMTGQLS